MKSVFSRGRYGESSSRGGWEAGTRTPANRDAAANAAEGMRNLKELGQQSAGGRAAWLGGLDVIRTAALASAA